MKFQNPSMHSSKVWLCIKVCQAKMPKMAKDHTLRSILSEFIRKLMRSFTHATNLFLKVQGSSFNNFLDILLTRFHPYFFKGP